MAIRESGCGRFAVAVCVVLAAMAGKGDFTVTTNGTVVNVTQSVDLGTVYTETYHAPEITKVMLVANKPFTYAPTGVPTYTDGTLIWGQVRVRRGDVFGSGDIALQITSASALLAAEGYDVTVTNKLIFSGSAPYATSLDSSYLTLKSVGTPADTFRQITLGRVSSGAISRITLALTEPASEAVNRINLQGACELTLDGGVIKALPTALSPFFHVLTAGDTADITVTANGVTFDIPAGATVDPGQPLKFPSPVRVLETYLPVNHDFETTPNTNWTYTHGGADSDSKILTPPTHWDGQGTYPPPNGPHYAMIRQLATLSTPISVPNDGLWRVAFLRGGRPGYSYGMTLDIKIDGETMYTFPARTADYPNNFKEVASEPFPLTAGAHTLTFALGSSGALSRSINVDDVRLERVEPTGIRSTVAKTGAGTLTLTGQDMTAVLLAAEGGTLKIAGGTALAAGTVAIQSGATAEIADSAVAGAVTVAAGGTNILHNVSLPTNGTVTVAAGGVLQLTDFNANLVANGSFEDNGPQTYNNNITPSKWKWTQECRLTIQEGDKTTTVNGDGGLQGNGGVLSASGPHTPAGTVTTYLREETSYSQTITVPAAGTYRVSLLAGDRRYEHSEQVPVSVLLTNATQQITVLTIPPRASYSDFVRYAADVALTPGEYTLKLYAGATPSPFVGNLVLVDDVRVRRIEPRSDMTGGGEVHLAAGAELNLDLLAPEDVVAVGKVFVDGTAVRGSNAALTRAGVLVTGEGTIQAGPPRGLVFGIR